MTSKDMREHIKIAEGFQNSVNIGFDLYNDEKIKGFIPTSALLDVIEDILLSTADNSTDRARILIGAYGKGKSHMILVALSLVFRKDIELFKKLLPQLKAYSQELHNFAVAYINSDKKLLPIIIQGNNASLAQSFLGSMQKALERAGLDNLMPETHFQAARDCIEKWKSKYSDTYTMFTSALNEPVTDFILKLSDFNVEAYERFIELYPSLTAGSTFNPFFGFDVIELYEKVIEELASKGYSGVYVIYDEFSKFLEADITKVSSVDIKLLQDFAEKCNRSREQQMHLLLISHEDISNYIDKLPKQKVDGWKGVSERFKHMEIYNDFSHVYEIISTVINQDKEYFSSFFKTYDEKFNDIMLYFSESAMFSGLTGEQLKTVVYGCYPLHPVSTFILPRLSEKVAQNERTLFTFLSSANKNTLIDFMKQVDCDFPMLTPDFIYDYFEPLFRKDVYTSDTHKIYMLTTNILNKLEPNSLGSKIVKTIALIYITGQFEKLPPVPEIIINTFRESVSNIAEITNTLQDLQDKHYVIYMKKSNNYLKLKNSIGIDIGAKIADSIERNRGRYQLKDILNEVLFDKYMYPTSYNDDNEITRYFEFSFIESDEFLHTDNWGRKIENISADGVVYGIITKDQEDLDAVTAILESVQAFHDRIVFVISRSDFDIVHIAYEYQAVISLKSLVTSEDDALIEEYNIYIEDLEEVIAQYISAYTKPEIRRSVYYYNGVRQPIFRKAQISQLLSKICTDIYTDTPIINNEAINKDFLSPIAIKSRSKVIAGLLSNQLEPSLGLSGTGQDISIMRSTLVMTGILTDLTTQPKLVLSGNTNTKIQNVLDEISRFIRGANNNRAARFQVLYDRLTKPEHHIGLKKGVIPIYIAVVLHSFKQYIVITRNNRELEINAELLNSIDENPADYFVCLEDWNEDKDEYIKRLEELFIDFILEREKEYNTFAYIVRAMQRWFIGLPKYVKEIKRIYQGNGNYQNIEKENLRFINSLKDPEINAREYLFEKVFNIFGYETITPGVVDNISATKVMLEQAKDNLIKYLLSDVRTTFKKNQSDKSTFSSVIKDWYEGLQDTTKNHLFSNSEERVLELMRTINNDEKIFFERLAKALTGLRIDDWEDRTINSFYSDITAFKKTVEGQDKDFASVEGKSNNNVYKIIFIDSNGDEQIKTFNKTKYSDKAELLFNDITFALDEYGEAITENEKRQVLMEIIEKLC